MHFEWVTVALHNAFWISALSVYSTVWLLHGWCQVKLLPSQHTFCVHHTTMHQFTVSLYSKPHIHGINVCFGQIIIKRISTVPINCTSWEHSVLYGNTNNTHTYTDRHARMHAHTLTHMLTHTPTTTKLLKDRNNQASHPLTHNLELHWPFMSSWHLSTGGSMWRSMGWLWCCCSNHSNLHTLPADRLAKGISAMNCQDPSLQTQCGHCWWLFFLVLFKHNVVVVVVGVQAQCCHCCCSSIMLLPLFEHKVVVFQAYCCCCCSSIMLLLLKHNVVEA